MFVTYLNMVNILFLLKSHFGSGFKPNLRSQLTSRKHWRRPEEKKTHKNPCVKRITIWPIMTNKKKRLPPSSPIFYQDPPNHQYGQWKSHIYFDDFASFHPATFDDQRVNPIPWNCPQRVALIGPDMVAPNHLKWVCWKHQWLTEKLCWDFTNRMI